MSQARGSSCLTRARCRGGGEGAALSRQHNKSEDGRPVRHKKNARGKGDEPRSAGRCRPGEGTAVFAVNLKMTGFVRIETTTLMTNTSFTKRMGSRTNMALDDLNEEMCKKAVVVFSFRVTTFECCQRQRPDPARQVVGKRRNDSQKDSEAENLGCFSIDRFCGFLPNRFRDTKLPPRPVCDRSTIEVFCLQVDPRQKKNPEKERRQKRPLRWTEASQHSGKIQGRGTGKEQ